MAEKYILLDVAGNSMQFFDAEEDRDEAAESLLQRYLDHDHDGWPEEAFEVVGAVVTHRAKAVNVQKRPDDLDEEGIDGEGVYWGDIDERCNVELRPVEEEE